MGWERKGKVRSRADNRAFSELDVLNLIYFALVIAVIVLFRQRIERWALCLAAYALVAATIVAFLVATARASHPAARFVRAWYSPLLYIMHYEFAYAFNQSVAPFYAPLLSRAFGGVSFVAERLGDRIYFDELLLRADRLLFGFQPSVRFAQVFAWRWFGEIMHMGYFTFFLLIPIVGATLWFKRRRREFDDMLFRARSRCSSAASSSSRFRRPGRDTISAPRVCTCTTAICSRG